jgi:hypothetical protein
VTPEIIVALIGVCGSALGSLIGIIANGKLTAYRLKQLEEKVDKHNNLVERTYEIETDIEVIKNDIKVANHRIDDLERKGA